MSVCEKCWEEAGRLALGSARSQTDWYNEVLGEHQHGVYHPAAGEWVPGDEDRIPLSYWTGGCVELGEARVIKIVNASGFAHYALINDPTPAKGEEEQHGKN